MSGVFDNLPVKLCILCFLVLSFPVVSNCNLMKLLMHLQHPTMKPNSCKPGCCKGMMCPMPKCGPNQMMKQHAGWCGCCPKCMTQLRMGSTCKPKPKQPCPKMPSSECKCGLKCMRGRCWK